jgi:hypothetical protein
MKPESELDRENILAILSLYEEGKLQQGQVVYAQDGQIFYEQPALKPGKAIWVEGLIMTQYPATGATWTRPIGVHSNTVVHP